MRGLAGAAVAALALGCTDAPFNLDWDHTYPEGLSVREGGVERVRVDKEGKVTGDLAIMVGARTGVLEVSFLDSKGAVLVPADDEYLEVTVAFSDLATFEPVAPGSFTGKLLGLKSGKTSVYFKLKQGEVGGGKGHWTSPAIDLTISR
jgi:hypothetical protein